MALAFKIGQQVKEIVPPPTEGEIVGVKVGESDGVIYYGIAFQDEYGDQLRWIDEDRLEAK